MVISENTDSSMHEPGRTFKLEMESAKLFLESACDIHKEKIILDRFASWFSRNWMDPGYICNARFTIRHKAMCSYMFYGVLG